VSEGKRKEYDVHTSPRANDAEVAALRDGVLITTTVQRDGVAKEVTAPTRPCVVARRDGDALRFVLQEGRNRQIRRMCDALGLDSSRTPHGTPHPSPPMGPHPSDRCAALGLDVRVLHRVGFSGVSLEGIEAVGTWAELTAAEELAIGARRPPTRDEQRTPEERARRKARKEERREASKQTKSQAEDETYSSKAAAAMARSATRKKAREAAAKGRKARPPSRARRAPKMSPKMSLVDDERRAAMIDDERRAACASHALALEHSERTYHLPGLAVEHSERTYHGGEGVDERTHHGGEGVHAAHEAASSAPSDTDWWDRYAFPGEDCFSRLGMDATAPAGFADDELARVSRKPMLSAAQCSAVIDEVEELAGWEETGRIAFYARRAGCTTPLSALPRSRAMLAPLMTSVLFPAIKKVSG
jgi:hypothetical protein